MLPLDAKVLRLSSPYRRNVREGTYMSWLDDWAEAETRRLKDEKADRDEERRRKEEISSQGSLLWDDVKYWMKKGIEKINSTPILHEKVGSDLSYADLNDTSFDVRSIGYPRIILTATRNGLYFKVNVKRLENGEVAESKVAGETETLTLDLDEHELIFVRTAKSDVLVREAVTEYLLHKFLV